MMSVNPDGSVRSSTGKVEDRQAALPPPKAEKAETPEPAEEADTPAEVPGAAGEPGAPAEGVTDIPETPPENSDAPAEEELPQDQGFTLLPPE